MSIVKKFTLSVAAALATVAFSAPSFAEQVPYMKITIQEVTVSDGGGGSGDGQPDLLLALESVILGIL